MSAAQAARSLAEALSDTHALLEVAERAGVSVDETRRVAAALADLRIVQALRICTTAQRCRSTRTR